MTASKIKLPAKPTTWGPTGGGFGAGALIGLKFGGPMGAAIGGVVGGAIGWIWGSKLVAAAKGVIPPSALQAISGPLSTSSTSDAAILAQMHQQSAAQVADSGPAKGPAASLYAYLKVHGPDGSNDLAGLVAAFQMAANADHNSQALTGAVPTTAQYDTRTSSALTIYTHDPIPPSTPPAPQPPPSAAAMADAFIPGAAANSSFNVQMYLKAHGNNPSDLNLQKLVHQFQIDANTDPKFPGPAYAGPASLRLLTTRLPETGTLDPATLAILSKTTLPN